MKGHLNPRCQRLSHMLSIVFRGLRLPLIAVLALLAYQPVSNNSVIAASFMEEIIDKEDGWVDGSDWVLENAAGFLPVPIIITEPAVGDGLGLAAVFFHPPDDYDENARDARRADGEVSRGKDDYILPDVSVVAAGATENDSWFVGGGHIAHWKNDHIRFQGVAGYASINTTFYGIAERPGNDRGIKFNAEGFFIDLPLAFRITDSDFFIGGGYSYTTLDTTTDLSNVLPPWLQGPAFNRLNLDTTLSSMEAFVQFDNRDNIFTPNTGFDGELSVARNDEAIGSDWEFTRINAEGHQYFRAGEKFVIGLRGDYAQVNGSTPFFAVPFIQLRGIPALRYQGESVLVGETEVRWAFHHRFSAVGFVGAGKAAQSFGDLNSQPTRVTKGAGIRYLTLRKLGMHAGIDVAKGPEDTYWYLTVGSSW